MIHDQQTGSCQPDRAVVSLHQMLGLELFVYRSKLLPNINGKLALEITGIELSGFQLQHHLANQSLLGCQRNRAINRQATFVNDAQVLFEVVRVLEINARKMRKRRYAEPDHVAAVPQPVTIDKTTSLLLCRDDVGTRNFVVVLQKLFK